MKYVNEINISGTLKFAPKCGRGSKSAYAFMKLEQPKERSSKVMQIEVAFFSAVAELVMAEMQSLVPGALVEVRGHLDIRRKQDDAGNWLSEWQIIGHEFNVTAAAPPPESEPPMPDYDESNYADGEIPF